MEPLLEGVPVWGRMDNAYYRQEVVEHFEERGWDYSISVTSATYKSPILEAVDEVLEEADWEPINDSERAAFVTYSSRKWRQERTYVVVRRDEEDGCRLLFPIYTVILVSRDDLPLKELVARHRAKQGQENAFKGPLTEMNLHHPRCAARSDVVEASTSMQPGVQSRAARPNLTKRIEIRKMESLTGYLGPLFCNEV